jgi:hypothetical protein
MAPTLGERGHRAGRVLLASGQNLLPRHGRHLRRWLRKDPATGRLFWPRSNPAILEGGERDALRTPREFPASCRVRRRRGSLALLDNPLGRPPRDRGRLAPSRPAAGSRCRVGPKFPAIACWPPAAPASMPAGPRTQAPADARWSPAVPPVNPQVRPHGLSFLARSLLPAQPAGPTFVRMACSAPRSTVAR